MCVTLCPSPYQGEGCPLGQGEVVGVLDSTDNRYHLTLCPSPYQGEGCPLGQGEVVGILDSTDNRYIFYLTQKKRQKSSILSEVWFN
ncbi:MAG: hypothetical protein QNJ47_02925 [Nostocaceae cyanobacterium]|nr:hypothetical protein [Nostocaceae cyanobacterium]